MAASGVPGRRHHYDASQDPSESSTSSDGIHIKNIMIPDHEVHATGPIRRSQYQLARVTSPIPQAQAIAARSNENESNKENKSEENEEAEEQKPNREAIACAGPNALQSLHNELHQTTLSRLPDWKTLEFSEHSKPATRGYARLRINIGRYDEKDMTKWHYPVHAYLIPNVNPKIGPNLSMEVRQNHTHGYDFVDITWQDDIALARVKLVPPFNQASSEPELYALIKYYYLLANESRYHGLTHDFIPINRTFIAKLKAVCNRYDPDYLSDASSGNGFYTDKDKSPKSRSRDPDRRRQGGYADHPGVATTKSYSGNDDTDDFVVDQDYDTTPQSSLHSQGAPDLMDSLESEETLGSLFEDSTPMDSDMIDADHLTEFDRESDTARHVTTVAERQMVMTNIESWTSIIQPPTSSSSDSRVPANVSSNGSISSQNRHRALRPAPSALSQRSRDSQRRRGHEYKRVPQVSNPMYQNRTTANSTRLSAEKILKAGHKTLSGRIEKKSGIKQKIKHVQELAVAQASILKEMIAKHESMTQAISRELEEMIDMMSDESEEEEE